MYIKNYILAIIVLFCLTNGAFAENIKYSKQYSECMAKSEDIKIEVQICLNDELDRQDDRLNKAYRKVMAKLSQERKKILKNVQRAWINYRDENCNFYDDGYSMHTLITIECFLNATTIRAKELEKIKRMYDDYFYVDDFYDN